MSTTPVHPRRPGRPGARRLARRMRRRRLPARASRPCASGCTRPSAASRRSRSGRRARRRPSTPPPWTASPCAQQTTVGASESTPIALEPGDYVVVDTGDPLPDGFDAVVMREHVHLDDERSGRGPRRRPALPARPHDRRGRQRHRAAPARGPSAAAGGRRRAAAAGAVDVLVRRRPVVAVLPTGDEIRPVGTDPAPGVILDTNSLMLAAQAEAAGCEAWRSEILPDDPDTIAAAVRDAATRADLVVIGRRVERRARRLHGEHRRAAGHAGGPRRGGASRPPGRPRRGRRHARPRRAGLPRLRCADVRHLRRPAAVVPGGRGAGRAAAGPGAGRAQARLADGDGRLGARAARPGRRRPRRDAAAARRRRADLARAGRRPARRARGTGGPPRGRGGRRRAPARRRARSTARSSPSGRTTWCSTSPRRRSAPPIRARRWPRPTSGRSEASSRCATGCATSPARTCSTRPAASTRCPYVDRVLDGRDVAVVRLVHRDQGLIVAAATRWRSPGSTISRDPTCAT